MIRTPDCIKKCDRHSKNVMIYPLVYPCGYALHCEILGAMAWIVDSGLLKLLAAIGPNSVFVGSKRALLDNFLRFSMQALQT